MFDNKLDVLDSMLKATGHEKWGWHIYRCTYSSDDDWSAFMEKLRTTTQSTIEFYGGTCRAVAKQHIFTVVEDRERLENATKSDVRSMFRDWVNSPEAAAEQPDAKTSLSVAPMARYLYCMHVDEESLRSVLDDSKDWHINIINRSWIPWEEEESDREDYDNDDEEDDDEAYLPPEIEGCTEEDVGWTKASKGILLCSYIDLCEPSFWYIYYSRPPLRAI